MTPLNSLFVPVGLAWCAVLHGSPAPDTGIRLEKLADQVYAVIRREPPGLINESNTMFVVSDTGVLVVDAQSSSGRTRATLAAIRSVTSVPVTMVVNTHWHDDHTIGNRVYRDSFPGARFIGHTSNPEAMTTTALEFRRAMLRGRAGTIKALKAFGEKGQSFMGGPISEEERRSHEVSALLLEDYSDGDSSVSTVIPTQTVSGRMTVKLGDHVVEVLHPGRGHTAGDLVVHLPGSGILATGDLVMWPVTFVGSTSFPADFARSLDGLLGLNARVVVPGHGPVLRGDEARDHMSLTARMLHYMNQQVTRAVKSGASLEEVRRELDLSQFELALTGGNPLRRALFDYYVRRSATGRLFESGKH